MRLPEFAGHGIRPPLLRCCSGLCGSARNAGNNPLAVEVFELPAVNGMVVGQVEEALSMFSRVRPMARLRLTRSSEPWATTRTRRPRNSPARASSEVNPRRAAPSSLSAPRKPPGIRSASSSGLSCKPSAGPKLRSVSSGTRRAGPRSSPAAIRSAVSAARLSGEDTMTSHW